MPLFSPSVIQALGFGNLLPSIEAMQRGGQSGRSGYRYEDYFVLCELICAAPASLGAQAAIEVKQGEYCLVDDVVIRDPSGRMAFHQLKTSPQVTWTADGRKLETQFLQQKLLCDAMGIRYSLRLVVTQRSKQRRLLKKIPSSLKQVTRVLYFRAFRRRPDLWGKKSPARRALEALCAEPDSESAIEELATAFYSGWCDHTPNADGYCSLTKLLSSIGSKETVPLRHSWDDTAPEWQAASALMKHIPNLVFETNRGFFLYRSKDGTERGRGPKCGTDSFWRFVARINKTKPQTFEELWETLP